MDIYNYNSEFNHDGLGSGPTPPANLYTNKAISVANLQTSDEFSHSA